MTGCPEPAELLLHVLQLPHEQALRATDLHVARCASCRATVMGLRETAGTLQAVGANAIETPACLDEMTVAMLAEPGVTLAARPRLVAHLAGCARCRDQLTSVMHLLRDSVVAAEIRRTDTPTAAPVTHRWRVAGAGVATALVASAMFAIAGSGSRASRIQPSASASAEERRREPSVATTAAPTLIAPLGVVAAADTFRWSGVPHADRYRVTVFDREGSVVWEAEAIDTAMAPQRSIGRPFGTAYLWKVEARTGWDRWVASELVEFSVSLTRRSP